LSSIVAVRIVISPSLPALSDSGEKETPEERKKLNCRIVALTHYLPPYMASVLARIAPQVREFRVLLSVKQEPNRDFGDTWQGMDVRVQQSLMMRRRWKHRAGGFEDEIYVHIPWDTFFQLRRAKPDIVFSYELGLRSLMSAVYCRIFRKKLALCVCVSERTEQGRGFLRPLLRKFLLKRADAVTWNGPSCRAYLKQFKVPDDRLFHFPYACSDQFQYRGSLERTPDARRRLVCIGQLTERKGILPMLEGLIQHSRKWPDRVVELDLIGKGNLEPAIREMSYPQNMRVRLLGHMNYEGMAACLEKCGCLVFPTMADEWGLVVNEAFHAGMPVIGSEYAQACTTLIENGKTGWLFRPDEPETLDQALLQLASTSDERLLEMRRNCQEAVREITPDKVANGAIAMFEKLLAKR
jgi:glycosyltransferase involved in cell wall biosynthesis